ncbi:alpha/beta hydrolase [uncultured Phenylobacterium sp.]|uniref:alpha/beta fold hydrolase n=1 Tax=uncultured Phenylobacterium sp. TaxID=349273 RepID=UPI0025DF9B34|nr:alpha/beta hydrolase [uncultured Phenylobacterium sp.]
MSGWRLSHVEADDVTIAVHRRGCGPAIVCLSALGHDVHDFDALAERVDDRFSLVCLEWPDHGESGSDTVPVSARRYADLVTAVLDRLGIEPPLVIGNSIGGAAAILHAARRPVRGLVLCDSGGLVEVTPLIQRICRAYEGLYAAGERGAWWFGAASALTYRFILPSPAAAAQRRRIVANLRGLAGRLREGWASFGRADANIIETAAALDVSVWVAWAKGDIVLPYAACRPALGRLRQATTTLFPGGHAPFLEQPESFARGLVAFADSLALPQAAPAAS